MTLRMERPKRTDRSGYRHGELNAIADEMNGRLRKTLDWAAPFEVYSGWLARLNVPPDASR